MKSTVKALVSLSLVIVFISGFVLSDTIKEAIEVYRNYIRITVNGSPVTSDNFLYNNTTYVPLKSVAQMLGVQVGWDQNTKTALLTSNTGNDYVDIKISTLVSPYNVKINLSELGISTEQIEGYKLEQNNVMINKDIAFKDGYVTILGKYSDVAGHSIDLNSSYTLKLHTSSGSKYKLSFITSGLPKIAEGEERQLILVPAMPEKGFHWPYYIAIPSNQYKSENKYDKRYMLVDTTNNGVTESFDVCLNSTYDTVNTRSQYSLSVAEYLNTPALMPVFPRPNVWYESSEDGWGGFYTHALDRDTATLHLKMEDPALSAMLDESFAELKFDIDQLKQLDCQLEAMIEHAIDYLNSNGFKLEEKVFMCGYSASGTFTDRFTNLHPDKVKAVASGGTLDDMMLPLDRYQNENLIFPIGNYDYKEITGRSFDINAHNQVARLIFMGEDDTNNVVPYSDCYGDRERAVIIKLWGEEVLPRASSLIKLYGEAGGKGIFILDNGVGHSFSNEMSEYILEFFRANIDSHKPQYPIPKNSKQLKYTLYE
ncbi:MAG: stalk domain-containing protein [Bacillota bacterium]